MSRKRQREDKVALRSKDGEGFAVNVKKEHTLQKDSSSFVHNAENICKRPELLDKL